VGQARGVVLLAAARAGLRIAEYTPAEVKQAVAGYGKADKPQMQEMVRIILGLAQAPSPDDAADALAIALCHAQTAPFLERTGQ
jgi:crossover junction endodeoxyribonuclease RuvC